VRRIATDGPVYYQFEQWAENREGPVHGIFTRLGGVSAPPWASLNVGSTVGDDPGAVARNKALMAAALGLDERRFCTVWQVHGRETIVVEDAPCDGGILGQADGIVTDRPGAVLTMRFADCVPILLYDPVRRVIGLAHAGWRGTVAGVAQSVVAIMAGRYSCRPEDIQAGIGPSIGPEQYCVGEEVVRAVQEAFGDGDGLIRRAADGAAYLDLWAANQRALNAAGVRQVEIAGLCTASRTHEFYSHRAEQGRTGRFGVVIALPGA